MTMPSEEKSPNKFDKFADSVGRFTTKSWFFAACVLLVVVWAPSYFLVGSFDTYQLLINTPTTIITFLLVALLQNTQERSDSAVHQKINALTEYLLSNGGPEAAHELREAVGLEERESSS